MRYAVNSSVCVWDLINLWLLLQVEGEKERNEERKGAHYLYDF